MSVVTSSDESEHAGSTKATGSDDQQANEHQSSAALSAQVVAPSTSEPTGSLLDSLPGVNISRVSSPDSNIQQPGLPSGTDGSFQGSQGPAEHNQPAESSGKQADHSQTSQPEAQTSPSVQPNAASGPISIAALMSQAEQQQVQLTQQHQQQPVAQPQKQEDLQQPAPGTRTKQAADPSSSACTTNNSAASNSEQALRSCQASVPAVLV